MITFAPAPANVFLGLGVALLVALLQAGYVMPAEPNDEGPKLEPESTLAAAQEGTEPALAVDESTRPEARQWEFRTWTDVSGKHRTEAAFLGFENGQVRLKKADGKIIPVAIEKLSDADQEYVKSQVALAAHKEEARTEGTRSEAKAKDISADIQAAQVHPEEAKARTTIAEEELPMEADQKPVESGVPEDAMATETEVQPGSTASSSEQDEQPEAAVDERLADPRYLGQLRLDLGDGRPPASRCSHGYLPPDASVAARRHSARNCSVENLRQPTAGGSSVAKSAFVQSFGSFFR